MSRSIKPAFLIAAATCAIAQMTCVGSRSDATSSQPCYRPHLYHLQIVQVEVDGQVLSDLSEYDVFEVGIETRPSGQFTLTAEKAGSANKYEQRFILLPMSAIR
jgi:hypothetical protein